MAVIAVFFVHGFLFASWTAHIPQVQQRLGLSDGRLGLVLLGAPIGSVLAIVVAAHLLPRAGSRRMVRKDCNKMQAAETSRYAQLYAHTLHRQKEPDTVLPRATQLFR